MVETMNDSPATATQQSETPEEVRAAAPGRGDVHGQLLRLSERLTEIRATACVLADALASDNFEPQDGHGNTVLRAHVCQPLQRELDTIAGWLSEGRAADTGRVADDENEHGGQAAASDQA